MSIIFLALFCAFHLITAIFVLLTFSGRPAPHARGRIIGFGSEPAQLLTTKVLGSSATRIIFTVQSTATDLAHEFLERVPESCLSAGDHQGEYEQ